MYFTPHEFQLQARAELKPERLEFEDVGFPLQCFPGQQPPSPIHFKIVEVLRTDDQASLNPEWWDLRSVGQFGQSTAVRLRFRGKAFSERVGTDRTPADGVLYETFARGGRVTLVVEMLGNSEDETRFDTLVVKLDYITRAADDDCNESAD